MLVESLGGVLANVDLKAGLVWGGACKKNRNHLY